jgi:hypothetical protein
MPSPRKRPIGITLLAVSFLWIGCIGTITYPFMGWTDSGMFFGGFFIGRFVHSAHDITLVAAIVSGVVYLIYVAYAIIGFGLWKLYPWARRAVVAVMVLSIFIGVCVLPFFIRPLAVTLACMGWTVTLSAWMLWYLRRPGVRFAFGLYPATADGQPPPGLSTTRKVWTGVACAGSTFGLFFVSLMFAVEGMFHSSVVYQMAIRQADASPCTARLLGTPFSPGWFTTGGMDSDGDEESANFGIPMHGPKGRGTLELEATRHAGTWKIDSLILHRGATTANLTVPDSPCTN